MSLSQIFILSQPIQSGKTTLLQEWIKGQNNIGGVLTPDINGIRKLLDLSTNTYHTLQLDEDGEGVNIGRFVFDPKGFQTAQKLLLDSLDKNFEWLIIDEIGRLELDRKEGLEPALSVVIDFFRTQQTHTKLLLVVRDYLLEDIKQYYNIVDATPLHRDFFLTAEDTEVERRGPDSYRERKIAGVVLCGGQSVRMRRDKAFIKYHSTEQYIHVADMMKAVCDAILISCNPLQENKITQSYNKIVDNATFGNAGPMTGVLSVFEQVNDSALMIIGCDYPYFTPTDMKALIEARANDIDVVCYHNPESGFDEPLLAIYEKQCAPLLLDFFKQGNTSLLQFLKTVRTKRIHPATIENIKSVDF